MSSRATKPAISAKAARLANTSLTKKQKDDIERTEALLREVAASKTGVREFTASSMSTVEKMMATEAVGLVDLEGLKKMREDMDVKRRGTEETERSTEREGSEPEVKKKVKKTRKIEKTKLSFQGDDEEEEDEGEKKEREKTPLNQRKRKADPTVDSSFLKTKKVEEWEKKQREELTREYLQRQEKIKQEPFEMEFCYYDGTYSKSSVTIKKGDQVWLMLDRTRKGKKEFHRGTVDDIMLVKDNIIIPHYYEFYYFIVNKVQTKNGLLFDFDNPEGADPKRTKVVHKSWYDKNKHIFPASTWKEFDPEVDYTKQVLRDSAGFVYFQQ